MFHEVLGAVYSMQSRNAEALEEFKQAVALLPAPEHAATLAAGGLPIPQPAGSVHRPPQKAMAKAHFIATEDGRVGTGQPTLASGTVPQEVENDGQYRSRFA